ncbi:MAG: T9SS type A sorting domain-containing protein [Bacteroidales bacterium]
MNAEVTSVDSALVLPSNEYRKRWTLFSAEFGYQETWIEGIGSSAGLIASGYDMTLLTGGDDYTLLCYYENDVLAFHTTQYPLCFYQIVGISEIEKNETIVTVNPNPVSGVSNLIVNYNSSLPLNLRIYNSMGILMDDQKIFPLVDYNIYSSDFIKGIYLYFLLENNKILFSDKFIIQ